MRLIYAVAGVYALGCVVFYWRGSREVTDLRRQLSQLRPQIREIARLKTEIDRTEASNLDLAELDRMRAEHRELIKLRGEVAGLRQYAAMDADHLRSEIESLEAERRNAGRAAELLETRRASRELSEKTLGVLMTYVDLLFITLETAETADDKFATSFEELERLIHEGPEMSEYVYRDMKVLRDVTLDGRSVKEAFEFMPQAAEAGKDGVETLLLRERVPRVLPDGGRARAYATTLARVEELISPDGDFAALEREKFQLGR